MNVKIFASTVEESAAEQIQEISKSPAFKDEKIRVMPDVHSGKGCVIGFTSTFNDKVIPNVVGVDIGCQLTVAEIKESQEEVENSLAKLDEVIRAEVPSGMNVHPAKLYSFLGLEKMHCLQELKNTDRIHCSIGTLGGGNHFIEVAKNPATGTHYLVIHTGSRNLGKQVAELYQKKAIEAHKNTHYTKLIAETIETLKALGREKEINSAISAISKSYKNTLPDDLCFLEGEDAQKYLHDMELCQQFARINHQVILYNIINHMGWSVGEVFSTQHNYINLEEKIIRKGAVSAQKGEKLIIPLNMRDGSLICVGKGNPDWNCSAPHGAGRIMSRNQARKEVTVEAFKDSMSGIYSTSVGENTVDEAPMAYKNMDEIIEAIGDTVDIIARIVPIYNFKAS